MERFNREIGRRTDVVGIFPDDASVVRLVSMLAIEANDEWRVGRSYISQKSMSALYAIRDLSTISPEPEEEELPNCWRPDGRRHHQRHRRHQRRP